MHTLLEVPKLVRIPYFDAPPMLGGKLTYLTHEEFQQKFGCHYTESLYTDCAVPEAVKAIDLREPPKAAFLSKVSEGVALRMKSPCQQIALGRMLDNSGYALFALDDIPAYTVIGFYAGNITNNEDLAVNNSYTHHINSDYFADAREMRGLGAFMAHLPTDVDQIIEDAITLNLNPQYHAERTGLSIEQVEAQFKFRNFGRQTVESVLLSERDDRVKDYPELASILFYKSDMKSQTAVDNILRVPVKHNDIRFDALITRRRIKKFALIGFDYGLASHWQNAGTMPNLYSWFGAPIPKCLTLREHDLGIDLTSHPSGKSVHFTEKPKAFLAMLDKEIVLANDKESISKYDLREELVKLNGAPSDYAAIPNNFAIESCMKRYFSDTGIRARTFWSNPKDKSEATGYVADVVFHAPSKESLASLCQFFQTVKKYCRLELKTQELVVHGINDEKNQDLRDFLRKKTL